jgi:hypothetical protein
MRPPGGLGTIDATMIRDITAMVILLIQQRSRIINLSGVKSPTKDDATTSPEHTLAPVPAPAPAATPPSAGYIAANGTLATAAEKQSKAQKLAAKFSKKPAAVAASQPQQQAPSSSRDTSPAKPLSTGTPNLPRAGVADHADSDDSLLPMGAKVAASGWRSSVPTALPAGVPNLPPMLTVEGDMPSAAARPSAQEHVTEGRVRAGSEAYMNSIAASGSVGGGSAEVRHQVGFTVTAARRGAHVLVRCAGGSAGRPRRRTYCAAAATAAAGDARASCTHAARGASLRCCASPFQPSARGASSDDRLPTECRLFAGTSQATHCVCLCVFGGRQSRNVWRLNSGLCK